MSKYEQISDLPEYMRGTMPQEAQELYLERFKEAWVEFEEEEVLGEQSQEAFAHREGWDAVKAEFVHDEEGGRWYRKGEEPEEEEEDKGLVDKAKELLE